MRRWELAYLGRSTFPKDVAEFELQCCREAVLDLATLRALYRRKPTRFEHRRWALEYSGLMKLDDRGAAALDCELRERTHATLARPRLEQLGREWLFGCSYLCLLYTSPSPRD